MFVKESTNLYHKHVRSIFASTMLLNFIFVPRDRDERSCRRIVRRSFIYEV